MHIVEPKVYYIAEPKIDYDVLNEYLLDIGSTIGEDSNSWLSNRRYGYEESNDPETLIEIMGRLCYKSWEPDLNPNVTRIREDQGEYLRNVIESRHGSVLSHTNVTFIFSGVSRVFTHELLRHMIGIRLNESGDAGGENISQESLRFVRVNDLRFAMPGMFDDQDRLMIGNAIDHVERTAFILFDKYNTKGATFHQKKQVTDAIRYLFPQGMTTELGWTCNVRALRHVIESRTAKGAGAEIRKVFGLVAVEARKHLPLLLADYTANKDGEWITQNLKV